MRTISPSPEVIHGHRPPVPAARKTSCEPSFSTQTANSLAMIIITRPDATEEQIQHIVSRIADWGLRAEVSRGVMRVVIGVIGAEDKIRQKPLGAFPGVESVMPVLKPYKLVSYEFRGTASRVKVGDVVVGAKEVVVMAGPCSVESEEQILSIAQSIRDSGAKIFRGGAFKPRTSPDWKSTRLNSSHANISYAVFCLKKKKK